jgi:hypothetical protein
MRIDEGKYRASHYIYGLQGLPTVYRADLDTTIKAAVAQVLDAEPRPTGTVVVGERRYFNNMLVWKPLYQLRFHGESTYEKLPTDTDGWERQWPNTKPWPDAFVPNTRRRTILGSRIKCEVCGVMYSPARKIAHERGTYHTTVAKE